MSSEQNSKTVSSLSLFIFAILGAFLVGALAFKHQFPPIPQMFQAQNTLSNFLQHPRRHHLQPSRGQGSGVVVNNVPDDDALIMLAGFFEDQRQIRLVRRDGTLFRKWELDYFQHFPESSNRPCEILRPLLVDTHGAQITPKGEVVLNNEYCGSVKLDQCGALMWSINAPTHHSLVPAEEGGYWILGRDVWLASKHPERFPPFSTTAPDNQEILEDTVMRVSESGEIIDEFSIPLLLVENGLGPLLTANGNSFFPDRHRRSELVHANQVNELPEAIADAFPLFEAGDLVISMRQLNLVIVIDPVTKELKWHQTGPWLRQHDAEFRPDGRISVFNNNTYRNAYPNEQTDLNAPRTTNIMAVDPVSRKTEVLFGGKAGQEMLSVIRGQHQVLENDGILITEFDAGRVLEVNAERQIVWEYVNAHDENFVGEITNASIYPASYFETKWKTCEP